MDVVFGVGRLAAALALTAALRLPALLSILDLDAKLFIELDLVGWKGPSLLVVGLHILCLLVDKVISPLG